MMPPPALVNLVSRYGLQALALIDGALRAPGKLGLSIAELMGWLENWRQAEQDRINPSDYDTSVPLPDKNTTKKASDYLVLSIFLCEIFIGQFFKERQIFTHFSNRG